MDACLTHLAAQLPALLLPRSAGMELVTLLRTKAFVLLIAEDIAEMDHAVPQKAIHHVLLTAKILQQALVHLFMMEHVLTPAPQEATMIAVLILASAGKMADVILVQPLHQQLVNLIQP